MNSPSPLPSVEAKRVYFSSLSVLTELLTVLLSYQYAIIQHVYFNAPYGKGSSASGRSADVHASVQIYSLALIFKLWSSPHYRSPTYKQDCIDNLKNVAVPGTGIPLSYFCYNYYICFLFVIVINPLICLLGAINKASHDVFGTTRERGSNGSSSFSTISPQRSAYTGIIAAMISKIKHVFDVVTTSDLHSLERFLIAVLDNFVLHLLHPDDWFSLWQMNCRLASYHSLTTNSPHYSMEDKWTFLVEGKELGVPISPFMTMETLVCKNKNIEGGMGIHFYKNATCGGDWILQEKFRNAEWLNRLLPLNSPLSTMRVITSSRLGLSRHMIASADNYNTYTSESLDIGQGAPEGDVEVWKDVPGRSCSSSPGGPLEATIRAPESPGAAATDIDNTASSSESVAATDGISTPVRACPVGEGPGSSRTKGHRDAFVRHNIKAMSAVLRLGRAGAATDHSSVLFDVDLATGRVLQGMSNAHWYKLGPLQAVLAGSWLPQGDGVNMHPDPPHPQVTGQVVPGMREALDIVVDAHFKMMPDVPMVGWDVAFTPQGVFLLEVNLSCNFFRGSFDLESYISFMSSYFHDLERLEEQGRRKEQRTYTPAQLRNKKVG